ncbi:MAG: anti-sigma factor antagonist [Clostridia bacterium]|nr:anti-sigma factor antagonist [Clostridia bacterium]
MDEKNAALDLTIPLSGRIDSNNAPRIQEELLAAVGESASDSLTIDAKELDYISSAGLRVLLRLRRQFPKLRIVNVSPEVYEIFEMTGFTQMMTVEKAFRTVSIEGCEEIGRGANGTVYRIDPDTVVKVYHDPESLDDILHEREMAKLALILGIPTAISYEVVKVGESYGSVFELLNAKSFTNVLISEPERFDECVREFADLLRRIHGAEAPAGKLPSAKAPVLKWAREAAEQLPAGAGEKLLSLIEAVPERNNLIHGDFHTKNIMLQNDEVLLIDMDTLSVGDPIFELGAVYNAFTGFSEYDHEVIKRFQGFDFETGTRFLHGVLSRYLGTNCESKIREVKDKARVVGYSRLISRAVRHGETVTEKERAQFDHWRNSLIELLGRLDELTFTMDDMTVAAEKEELPEVLRFIEERTAELEPSPRASMQITLAAEEVFINIASYAYGGGPGSAVISVRTSKEPASVTITFTDSGVRFDPLAKADPDTALPAEKRTPGGLGIFLTKQLMDEVSYEYRDGKNVLTVRKGL